MSLNNFLITIGDVPNELKYLNSQLEYSKIGFNESKEHFHFGQVNYEFLKENIFVFSKKATIYFSSNSIELLNLVFFQAAPLSEIFINRNCILDKLDFDFYNTLHYKNLRVSSF